MTFFITRRILGPVSFPLGRSQTFGQGNPNPPSRPDNPQWARVLTNRGQLDSVAFPTTRKIKPE
jgi:hypothetical protein